MRMPNSVYVDGNSTYITFPTIKKAIDTHNTSRVSRLSIHKSKRGAVTICPAENNYTMTSYVCVRERREKKERERGKIVCVERK